MIDTLKLSQGLQKAGMSKEQAEGVTEALRDAQADYVTKDYLDVRLKELELRLTKLMNETRHQTLWAIGLLILAQIGLHFWR
jgi:hypothetical protein